MISFIGADSLKDLQKVFNAIEKAKSMNNDLPQVPRSDGTTIRPRANNENNKDVNTILPIIVFSCNRPEVRRCLDSLLKYRPDPNKFPIIVSQDCGHVATAEVIQSFGSQVTHIQANKSFYFFLIIIITY